MLIPRHAKRTSTVPLTLGRTEVSARGASGNVYASEPLGLAHVASLARHGLSSTVSGALVASCCSVSRYVVTSVDEKVR
jgi:hypothetical protein